MATSTLQVSIDTNIRVLEVRLSTLWPLESALPVKLSTSRIANGDAGSVLPVVFTTTSKDEADLAVLLDVAAPDGVLGSAPATGPVLTGTIQERVGGGVTASLQREDGTHPSGGSVSLQHTQALGDGTYKTHAVNRSVAAAPYGKSWERQGGIPIATLDTPNPSDVLDDTILPELVRVYTVTSTGGSYEPPGDGDPERPKLYGLDARLGVGLEDGAPGSEDCIAEQVTASMPGGGRQTRLALARAAVAEAGMSLVVLGTIPNATRFVETDYTTDGQTAASVLSDMLLTSNPRVWYTPGTVYVDGRTFTGGAGSTDPLTFIAADDLEDDGASWQDQAGSSEEEPVLADYTADCDREEPTTPTDPSDPEVESTFETFRDGTYTWTERTGTRGTGGGFGAASSSSTSAPSDYQEITHSLRKEGGQLTEEVSETRGYFKLNYTSLLNQWGIVSRNEIANTYHPVCPEALVERTERTMQRKRISDIPNVSNRVHATEDTPYTASEEQQWVFEGIPTWYTEQDKAVTQNWHAEGWLRSRMETTRTVDGMLAESILDQEGNTTGYDITLLYRTEYRRESYTPVGSGLWHIETTVEGTEQQAVWELVNPDAVEGDPDYGLREIFRITTIPVSNTYTVVTDQAPPSVSCGQGARDASDPCKPSTDPKTDCIAEATERWEIDHADWEARQAHNGPKRVWSIQANRLLPGKRVGQTLGGGLIAGVTHTLEAVGGSTTMEVWEWLA